ncbi:Histidine N-alpha-methyltransferase [uncultured archaeon]|nr:Histidine N-alpha-methyltransferase [uncultured archaeon]
MGKVPPEQKINDLIFKELLKRGYSLDGKTRVWNIADSKLWYLTPEQAQAFLDLEGSKEYHKDVIQKEIDLINDSMTKILEKIKNEPLNVIDLGCGDGKKAALFIGKLKNTGLVRYCPIDISSYMVEKAVDKINKLGVGEVVEFQWNISDFENMGNITSLLRHGKFKNNLILLLGNTLGNFEIHELLYGIRSSMKDGDLLLIGNGLNSEDPKMILKAYDNKLLDNLLFKTLDQIGFKKENIKYGARFVNSRVEMYYTIMNDFEISFLGKKIQFQRGDQIIVALSYKYNQYDFRSFLNMYFSEVDLFATKDSAYALALCKK